MTALPPPSVISRRSDLPDDFDVATLPAAPAPDGVLLCAPDEFDIVDVKNPHMAEHVGSVDRELATEQWDALKRAFTDAGLRVEVIPPLPGCEDMVFTANQTLTGVAADGRPTTLIGRMRHASRQREVAAFVDWFAGRGWHVVDMLPEGGAFEGAGDVVWHPGRQLAWAGHGFRSDVGSHGVVSAVFGVPVISLALRDERFYHLDTCLCPLDERRALAVRDAFDDDGWALLGVGFEELIECDPGEAEFALACNAAVVPGTAVIDRRAAQTAAALRRHVANVISVDTGEFLKSGGSVFCLKQWLYPPAR
ncbi:MAG: amidinotransferase [Planctomycetota bacterium]|nr:MAG: amidinotransferase [Planctomycetota bacterium]